MAPAAEQTAKALAIDAGYSSFGSELKKRNGRSAGFIKSDGTPSNESITLSPTVNR
jgi:hypothetical protein